ncbi:MAG: GGDEF domain-containing protein [Armatimonadota bacterium]|nr:GGDEF domain-containing protein [Armatimonadota bacterium]
MTDASQNKNPQKIQPRKAATPSGISGLIRRHLLGLSLLAVLAVAGQAVIQSASHKQDMMEWGLTALTLLALLAQGASVFSPGSVRRALDAQRNMEAHMTDRDAALAEADKQMTEMRNLLANLVTVDTLTGLKNHRAFQEQLDVELGRALRHDRPLSLLLIDVDRFKSYNESYGHPNGDRALKRIAGIMKENARTSDIPARFGGEEFAVILTETDMMGAVVIGERLRQAISGGDGLHRPLTASIGIATLAPGMCGAPDLIAQADRALCAAKGDGRNRVSHAHQLPATEDRAKSLYAHAA